LFSKRNRFIENYPTSVVEKRLLKPLVHSNVTHARRERFHTELNLDTPPVGYYHITNYASPSAQHHFSRQNRTFDWQHLPSHQSTQPKPVQTIVIHDDDDKQIARQINLSLK
jgi:S-adenosylmethionine synthetase